MGFEEMVVAIIGTVAGVGLFGFIIARVTGLIKAWIERNKGGYDEDTFNRLAKAFMEHKKETERRLRNLEAIVTDDEFESSSGEHRLTEPQQTIEIEDEEETQQEPGDRNLRNMLKN